MDWKSSFERKYIDVKDPNPWLALQLDESLPMHREAKKALLRGHNTWSRRILLPLIRPLARLMIIIVQLIRMLLPAKCSSSRLLHKTIYWGLRFFVTRDARYLIMRHFHIGSELLRFIADNAGIESKSLTVLRPEKLEDLIDDAFLIHDFNIYNFILELNSKLSEEGRVISPPDKLNFDAITDNEFDFELEGDGPFNVIDLHSAIEMYTPMYALFLSDHDFWRASNSLQLDETIAIYVSKILDAPMLIALVNNKHPTVPISTLQAGFRLMLHGLDAEILHGHLRECKREMLLFEQASKE